MEINCPACGALLDARLKYSKLIVCAYCQMAIFLEDEAAKVAGKMSVLTNQPSLLSLGRRFSYRQLNFVPIGRIRYAYPNGIWEEWWVLGDDGIPYWVSVDEGDVAIETKIEVKSKLPPFTEIFLGQEININGEPARVTEKNTCKCDGAQGELPFHIKPDESRNYADLTGQGSDHYTLEDSSDGIECFKGKWVDPFEVKAA